MGVFGKYGALEDGWLSGSGLSVIGVVNVVLARVGL